MEPKEYFIKKNKASTPRPKCDASSTAATTTKLFPLKMHSTGMEGTHSTRLPRGSTHTFALLAYEGKLRLPNKPAKPCPCKDEPLKLIPSSKPPLSGEPESSEREGTVLAKPEQNGVN